VSSPRRIEAAEHELIGHTPDADHIARAAALVGDNLGETIGDHYASADYRRHLAGVLAKKALTKAAARAG
jgi:carbon-monoxide dehydrogenase medium subunit